MDQRFKASWRAEALQIAAMGYMPSFEQLSLLITELDLLIAFAHVCVNAPVPYVRPTVLDKEAGVLELRGSRHPCMEVLDGMLFIPNDVLMKRGTHHTCKLSRDPICVGSYTACQAARNTLVTSSVLLAHSHLTVHVCVLHYVLC